MTEQAPAASASRATRAVLRGEATAWLAAGSLADAALENFK